MWCFRWSPRPPQWMRRAGMSISYRKKLSGWSVLFLGIFMLMWQLIKLCFMGVCWLMYGAVWVVWWMAADLVLAVIWLVRLISRAIRKERPLFPPFLQYDDD